MGIPGLASRLEPYSSIYSPTRFKGYSAVIDGPSLAYYAHKVANSAFSTQAKMPSYIDINSEAIRWLNSLEDQGIQVSSIIFDGALPEEKRTERLRRIHQGNARVLQMRSSFPANSCPVPKSLGTTSHAFLAASLREALAESPFASRTSMVPGEADGWCALHAKDTGKMLIFTSDTDLLLYEYHADTVIVFFPHLGISTAMKALSPYQISQKMQLAGLLPLAYLVNEQCQGSTDEIINIARAMNPQDASYLGFCGRYCALAAKTPVYLLDEDGLTDALQTTDARVSEFIHQALSDSQTVSVYLPLLVEAPDQGSAYTLGQDIRILAYSLLAPAGTAIQEYARKAQGVSPHEITPYASTEIETWAMELETRLDGLLNWAKTKHISPALFWPIFAMSLVVAELNTPAPLQLVMRVFNSDFNLTWEFIHLNARIQAVLYSLRMLKQVIAVCLNLPQQSQMPFHRDLHRLHSLFSTFPSIADMFGVPGQLNRVLADDNALADLIVEVHKSVGVKIPTPKANKSNKNKRRNHERKKKKAEEQKQTQGSGNVFIVLQNNRTLE